MLPVGGFLLFGLTDNTLLITYFGVCTSCTLSIIYRVRALPWPWENWLCRVMLELFRACRPPAGRNPNLNAVMRETQGNQGAMTCMGSVGIWGLA